MCKNVAGSSPLGSEKGYVWRKPDFCPLKNEKSLEIQGFLGEGSI